jgi:hypothetical protein
MRAYCSSVFPAEVTPRQKNAASNQQAFAQNALTHHSRSAE